MTKKRGKQKNKTSQLKTDRNANTNEILPVQEDGSNTVIRNILIYIQYNYNLYIVVFNRI